MTIVEIVEIVVVAEETTKEQMPLCRGCLRTEAMRQPQLQLGGPGVP